MRALTNIVFAAALALTVLVPLGATVTSSPAHAGFVCMARPWLC